MVNRCSIQDRFFVPNAKAINSCFKCGREGHVASRDRRIEAVSVEKPKILVGVSVETLDIKAVLVETPTIQIEPKARVGLDRETTDGSCRATRRLPASSSEWLPAIHCQRV